MKKIAKNPVPIKARRPLKSRQGRPPLGRVTPMTDADRVRGQIARGEVRAGPEAAREIARKIEDGCDYWRLRRMDLRSRPDNYAAPVQPKMAA